MSAVPIPVRVVPDADPQARIGALRAVLREMSDRQQSRIVRVQTAYLMDRLGVEMRHLDRLRQEAERVFVEGMES